MKALVIDDDPFMLSLLTRQLAALDVEDVAAYGKAAEALAALGADRATTELIVCDLQMPEMDGVEFIRHLVGLGYVGRLILVSGEDERILDTAERLARSQRLEVLGALRKPVSREALQQLLARRSPPCRQARGASASSRKYSAERLGEAIAVGELVNHYQPKIALETGALVGVEALARWRHPQDGLVHPDCFIAVAEERGLIEQLTRSVLRTALAQLGVWREQGLQVRVAVNVSMENLRDLDFPDFIARALAEAEVAPTDLVLELTESRLMTHPSGSLDILTRLRLKRIGLSIDDFGTGHSSLAQLLNIPFDELKIDRQFVHGAHRDHSRQTIFEASIAMARQLGLRTVAEGIEDRADWDFVRRNGADLAQGYFVARPMAAADLPAWWTQWEGRRDELIGSAT